MFKNRTRKALDEGNLHYRLEGGAGLDFLYLNEPFGWRDYIYIDDGEVNKVRFLGS